MATRLSPMLICVSLILISGLGQLVICSEEKGTYNDVVRMKLGGFSDSTNSGNGGGEIDDIALFAVQEHNKRENGVLELARVLKATEQVVAGKLYSLTLEVLEAGEKKIYEAKVWVKPWIKNFKQLQEFKSVVVPSSFTASDLGLKSDGNGFDWRLVSTEDPEVQEAAKHAMKSIQQRSNSLFPYKLIDIILARAKVVEDRVKFELLLKLEKGNKAEKLMVEVMNYQNGELISKVVT